MPPPFLRKAIAREHSPSLQQVFALAVEFDVSKEAMARAYADHHPDDVAFVVVRDGQVLRTYRNRNQFPFITLRPTRPPGSLFHKAGHQRGTPSDIDSRPPAIWIDIAWAAGAGHQRAGLPGAGFRPDHALARGG